MLIHIGKKVGSEGRSHYLFLRKVDSKGFVWFEVNRAFEEKETDCVAAEIPLAFTEARKKWHTDYFKLLHCGFRYSLPVRDEVGCNALFWEMVSSYSAPNGQFLDSASGQFYYVDNASDEALTLWRNLRNQKKK